MSRRSRQCPGCSADTYREHHDTTCTAVDPLVSALAVETLPEKADEMTRLYGSKFSPCPCGRERVLMYRRAHGDMGASNGPDADRLTLHDTPRGVACEHGGKLVADVAREQRAATIRAVADALPVLDGEIAEGFRALQSAAGLRVIARAIEAGEHSDRSTEWLVRTEIGHERFERLPAGLKQRCARA